jgi:UDP-N-acetylmuramoylalanine--D-glutamate ligase
MLHRPPLPVGPWLVVGLARSGAAAARALWARGEPVICVDAGAPAEAEGLRAEGLEVWTGVEGLAELERARAVVKSPGVPREAPVIAEALRRGLPVVGELEVGWRLVAQPFVAVTGTNGKTTTVELLGEIWRAAGREVAVAGNVGTAVSSLAGRVAAGTTIACEASSFQLEDTLAFAPQVGLILNVTPDHLDRHRTFEAYREAKLRLFARQGPQDVAVGPRELLALAGGEARRVSFGAGPGDDLTRDGDLLRWHGEPLLAAGEVRLRGPHNLENAMGAAAAALSSGIGADAVATALTTFAGVEHRIEEVAEIGGVLWVNDSKATNTASANVAVGAFAGGVHLILGGQGKGQDFTTLRGALVARARAAYLIGEDAEALEDALDGTVPLHRCGDLEHAVAAAHAAARPGEVVLLSPACASFDQYPGGFEERGAHFRALVRALAG